VDGSALFRNERHASPSHNSGSDPAFGGAAARAGSGTIAAMTEQTDDRSLPEQLEEIRTQLAWVRDYL